MLMEAGYSWLCAQMYRESCIALERADELASIRSVVSIGEETASLVISDGFKPYRCPEYERALILFLLAMNHFMLGEVENALVELRRLVEFASASENRDHRWLAMPVVHYLSGVCYFRLNEYDNARREFRIAFEMAPSVEVYGDAVKLAETYLERDPLEQSVGWLVCFVESGLAPRRIPAMAYTAIPAFARSPSAFADSSIVVLVEGAGVPMVGEVDIEHLAVSWLEDRAAWYLAKEVGSVAAREILADKIGDATDSRDAETIARLALFLTRSPDLRSWQALPQRISVAATPFPEYRGPVAFRLSAGRGEFLAESVPLEVKMGKITAVLHRALN
jgi:hypothetical protein